MFRFHQASADENQKLVAAAREAAISSPDLLTLKSGLSGKPPAGYAHDISRSDFGHGQQIFDAARSAFLSWQQFNLGWVQVLDSRASIEPGQLVGVVAHTAFLWSVNFSRIVETVDNSSRFGFMYATTDLHVEGGQERFVIEFEQSTGAVSYLIEAVSRPRHPLARMAYPFTRAMQHRFAKDSHASMQRYVRGTDP